MKQAETFHACKINICSHVKNLCILHATHLMFMEFITAGFHASHTDFWQFFIFC